jgi:Pyruvate/2-oxoacid:ferredoxin oxidoreductase gamma subunit/ferredoxin
VGLATCWIKRTHQSSLPQVFFGGDAAFGPKNIITAVAHGHEAAVSIDLLLQSADIAQRPSPLTNLMSQKMGIHEWSYDNDASTDLRYKVPWAKAEQALASIKVEVELGFDVATAFKEAQRCLNCDVQTVFNRPACIECDACVDICPMDCISFTADGEEADLRTRLQAPALKGHKTCMCPRRSRRAASWPRTKTFACTAACAPSAAPPGPGTCRSFCSIPRRREGAGHVRSKRLTTLSSSLPTSMARARPRPTSCLPRPFCAWVCPVSPRNIFPSNIQGLPTWYEVRVSGKGWQGRRGGIDMMVAMNPQTWDADVAEIEPGGYLFYDSTRPLPPSKFRDDVHVIGMPLTEICNAVYHRPAPAPVVQEHRLRRGAVGLLGMEAEVIEKLFAEQYKGKEKLLAPNVQALHLGRMTLWPDTSRCRWACGSSEPTRWATRFLSTATARRAGLCLRRRHGGGVVPDHARRRRWPKPLPEILQNTGWTQPLGKTSSPSCRPRTKSLPSAWSWVQGGTARGLHRHLRSRRVADEEFIGLAYFAEIPVTIINVQRGGPSTGMPTRTQQADVLSCAYASMAIPSMCCCFPEDPTSCLNTRPQRSTWPTVCKRRCL